MIKVQNLAQVNSDLDRWMALVRKEAEDRAKRVITFTVQWLASQSPQFSGDFAANWVVGIGTPNLSFIPDAIGGPEKGLHSQHVGPMRGGYGTSWDTGVFQAGDAPAVEYAVSKAVGAIASIKLGDTVYVSNSAAHDEPYALLIEENKIKFRPENMGHGAVLNRFLGTLGNGGFPV